jgi:hypothetical protein
MQLLLMPLILLWALVGCSSTPKESAELSRHVGDMIAATKVAHIAMVNRYFDRMKSEVEEFTFHAYKNALLANVRKIAKEKDPHFEELSFDQYDQVMTRIQQRRDEWVREVEKGRHTVLLSLEEHYGLLTQANASLTALLRSAANLNQTEAALLDRYGASTGLSSSKLKEWEDKVNDITTQMRSLLDGAMEAVKGKV